MYLSLLDSAFGISETVGKLVTFPYCLKRRNLLWTRPCWKLMQKSSKGFQISTGMLKSQTWWKKKNGLYLCIKEKVWGDKVEKCSNERTVEGHSREGCCFIKMCQNMYFWFASVRFLFIYLLKKRRQSSFKRAWASVEGIEVGGLLRTVVGAPWCPSEVSISSSFPTALPNIPSPLPGRKCR